MDDYEKLYFFIKNKELTLKDFGEKIGVSKSYFALLRRTKGGMTIGTINKIVQKFPDFNIVGFIKSQSLAEWEQCLASTPPPPPENLDKNQISQRLLIFFKEFNINDLKLNLATGVGKGYIGNMQLKRNGFTTETLRKIFLGFPELNERWVLIGQGGMIKKTSNKKNNQFLNDEIKKILLQQMKKIEKKENEQIKKVSELINTLKNQKITADETITELLTNYSTIQENMTKLLHLYRFFYSTINEYKKTITNN